MAEKPKNLPIQFGKITNPTVDDLHFMYDSAQYILKAGETEERWPAHLAKHAAKKLADKNIMTNNPEEHRVLMGIDLTKIRKEAITKEQAKVRVINLEAQMLEMKKEIKEMKEIKSGQRSSKKEKEEAKAKEKAEAKAKKKAEKEAKAKAKEDEKVKESKEDKDK